VAGEAQHNNAELSELRQQVEVLVKQRHELSTALELMTARAEACSKDHSDVVKLSNRKAEDLADRLHTSVENELKLRFELTQQRERCCGVEESKVGLLQQVAELRALLLVEKCGLRGAPPG
jgi:predicted  nucleic acid-binding Zn-ribbon protein